MPLGHCVHCRLPLPTGRLEARFCCSGCRFVFGVLSQVTEHAEGREREDSWLRARLVLCVFFAIIVMMFSLILYAEDLIPAAAVTGAADEEIRLAWRGLIRLFLLAAATPVMALLWWPLARELRLVESWRERASDLLILLGSAAAFALSALATFLDGPRVYFETATAVLVLVTLGRMLETKARARAAAQISTLSAALPKTHARLDDEGERQVPIAALERGDRLRLRPGEQLAVDARILCGQAAIDESSITGESLPARRGPGETLYGGSRNLSGLLEVEVERGCGERLVDRVEALLKEARRRPGARVRLAERLAAWLLPAITLLAVSGGLAHGLYHADLMRGVAVTLSVVLIACPCALGLATPLAVWVGLERCARRGLLLRSGEALELLAEIKTLCLDKTGTLTTGELEIQQDWYREKDELGALGLASTLAAGSRHPAARAIARAAEERGVARAPSPGLEELAGEGLSFGDGAAELRLGRFSYLDGAPPEGFEHARLGLTRGGQLLACWSLEEQWRPELEASLRDLARRGLELVVLTGDRPGPALARLESLGVTIEHSLLPEDKRRLLLERARFGPVAMLGDGINDAPALRAASVGLAMAGGVDLALETADGTVVGGRLASLSAALDIAAEVKRRIRWNLFWAFAYNVLGLGLALAGLLQPAWAAAAMVLSSALIVSTTLAGGRALATAAPSDSVNRVDRAERPAPDRP